MVNKVNKLKVKFNDKVVGYLANLEGGQIGFQYDEEWLKNGFSISPFSLPLENRVFINKKTTFNGLYGVFWDSLPDGWGELVIRRMMKSKGINFDNLTMLQRLMLVNNGHGALTYEPCSEILESKSDIDLDKLATDIKSLLNDVNEDVDLDKIYKLGGSSGGARPKAIIKICDEEYIIKFPCLIDPIDVGKKEYNANMLAKDCGINVNEFKLFESKICSGYFGAKRFDRENHVCVHMISLSSILETTHKVPNLDYYHLFQVVQRISVDKEDMYEVFRRMCFNVLYGNRDDHGKNFAFLYDEKLGGYKLSPAYDITCTPEKVEHEMTVNGNGKPSEKDLLLLANEFGLLNKKCKEILKNIKNKLNLM